MAHDPHGVFHPLGIAVLTVSDTRTEADDASGDLLVARVGAAGHKLVARDRLPDDLESLKAHLDQWAAQDDIDVILTTGGTGLTGRDVTPEAVVAISDKLIPGFGELFRSLSFKTIGTATIQSRAIAGVIGSCFVFALPGSPSACRDGWDEILAAQLDNRTRPCNFAELIPRLGEI